VIAALFVMVAANLGIMIPSSPGYVGIFHFFAMRALGVFGVGWETALSYAVNLSLLRMGAEATLEG